MIFAAIVSRAAGLVVTGVAGAAAYDGVKRVVRGSVIRGAAVTVTSWGLRGARAAETGAERARLTTSDIVSEAREKIGEQVSVPGSAVAHDHQH